MGSKSDMIPVYTVDVFSTGKPFFWMGEWSGIGNAYPHLALPHKQMFYTLIHVQEPGGHIIIDHEVIYLTPFNVICIKPGSIVQVDIAGRSNGYMICFSESFFSLRYNSNVLQRFAFLSSEVPSRLNLQTDYVEKWHSLNALMFEEYKTRGSEQVLRSYLNIILNELDRCNNIPGATEQVSARLNKVIQFEKMVEEHYYEWKTPAAYAAQLYITTNYLNKLCQEYRSSTAGEIIRKRVVIEAQRSLHYTSLSVGEIAVQLGFESLSYFVTFFKKNTGVTPETFRKNR
ncbi:helix-turn-helix domain-containing protein [Niabella sp. 22666]|uniref:helix-turn-helix domain-containing protein n=1 Tax=Niabella sp. 22666 TaxID=3453954 RepID=UPI003F8751F3